MSVYLRLPSYELRPLIKAIVFYGRRYSVRLLNCYLERNLLRGGGLLSEVPVASRCLLSSSQLSVFSSADECVSSD